MSTREQHTPTILTSAVRNTGGRSGPQGLEEPTSDEVLRELCDKNYHQLLPLIAEKIQKEKEQQDKLNAVSLNTPNLEEIWKKSKKSRRVALLRIQDATPDETRRRMKFPSEGNRGATNEASVIKVATSPGEIEIIDGRVKKAEGEVMEINQRGTGQGCLALLRHITESAAFWRPLKLFQSAVKKERWAMQRGAI
ncbi:hypothetical protein Tco_1368951 [Tanacetum coccineum]